MKSNLWKKKREKIIYYLKSKYSTERIEKAEGILRGICCFLIFINMCTVMLNIRVLASDIEDFITSDTGILTVVVSNEQLQSADAQEIKTYTLDKFSEEIDGASSNVDLTNSEESIYNTKRLIVLSNTSKFDNYNAKSVISYDDLYVLSYNTEEECKNAYHSLKNDNDIISVEIDSVMTIENNEIVNNSNNSMDNTETDLKKYLNSKEVNEEVKVAILDTGIDTESDVFKNRITDVDINSIMDDNGHGTEIATLIVNNSNENVKLMPIKVANADGKATILNTYIGIKKAIDSNVKVINISMNAIASSQSQILKNIINEATNKGILVVVSAGNNASDVEKYTPSNISSAIVVSAVENDNIFSKYSNYGATVDYSSYGSYNGKTGTSYAAANVTGIIGDLLSRNEQISILNKYAIDLGDSGFDNYYGNGLVSGFVYDYTDGDDKNDNIIDNIVEDNDMSKDELSISATYKTDKFTKEYSNGYIRNRTEALSTSGVTVKKGKDISENVKNNPDSSFYNREHYTANNPDKGSKIYIDYSKAARYIESDGSPKWLDMRMYVWTDNGKTWAIKKDSLSVANLFNDGVQKTTLEMHFYTPGHCGDANEEQSFKGILRITDLDTLEGVMFLSGYNNKFYRTSDTIVTYVEKGKANSNNPNNPFDTSNTASHPYFFGTKGTDEVESTDQQCVWVEVNASKNNPLKYQYATKNCTRGSSLYYTGTAIKYNVRYKGSSYDANDKNPIDTQYCVPYGKYSVINSLKIDGLEDGYHVNAWYSDKGLTKKVADGSEHDMGTSEVNYYGEYVPNDYKVSYAGNGATSGSTSTSSHTYDVAKNLTTNGFKREYTVTYNYNGNGQSNGSATAAYKFNGWATSASGSKVYNNSQSVKNLTTTNGGTVTLYANWTSTAVTLPSPARTGYIFAGWYDAANGGNKIGNAGAGYTPTANKTLYAHWTPITYNVAYAGNGATSGSTATSSHTYDVDKNLTANGYVRAYTVTYNYNGNGQGNSNAVATYIFNGWATSASGSKVYNNTQSVKNLTTINGATVTLYANWTSTAVILPSPSRTGHNFLGWYDAANGGNKVGNAGASYTPTENKTLYAHWEPWTLNTSINLVDSETKNIIQDNANFKIYEYNKNTGNYSTVVMSLTQKADKTYITPSYLIYSDTNLGKFRIIEETAPYGYYGDWKDSTETQKKYYDINIEEIIRTKNYNGQTVSDKGTINLTIENDRVKGKINVNIIDTETKAGAQADATLEGAVYGIYAKENIVHADGLKGILYKKGSLVQRATIVNGKLTYSNLELGEYYIKQITPPNGYTKSEKQYDVILPYEGEKVELVERNVTVEEKVNKQAFQLIKIGNVGDNDEFETLEGAGFKIYLISNLSKVKNGEIVKNSNGTYNLEDFKDYDFSNEQTALDYTNKTQGENIPEIFTDSSGYLLSSELAYGQYIVYESTVPEERVEIKPFFVTIEEDSRTPKKLRVFYDAEFTAKIQVVKKDSKTNKIVLKANAKYRILNKETNQYVEQWITYPSKLLLGTAENPYSTDETGTMTTPLTLSVGEYELQEVTAPDGYVLSGHEGKSQQGVYTAMPKENVSFKVSKTMVMEFDEDTQEAIMKVEQYNEEQVGSLTIDVSGEYLSGYTKDNNQNYKFDYQVRPIEGIEFTLYAKYNIYSQDNQNDIVYSKDEAVKKVYSNRDGKCIIDNLPIGNYYIKQTKVVDGFVLNKLIKDVDITYEGQEKAVVYRNETYNTDRQKIIVQLINKDVDTGDILTGAKFALYTKDNINYTDKNGIAQTINADEMIYEVTADENGVAKWEYTGNVDLPLGSYYIKQIEAPYGYATNTNIVDINAKYRGAEKDVIEINIEFTNQKTKVNIVKQDAETKNGLKDVEMKLLNSKREEISSWTTDETGSKEILKLQPGETYIVQEVKARKDYINDIIVEENNNEITKTEEVNEVTFKVNDVLEAQNIVLGNKSKVGNINIIKKGEVLVGTEKDENENTIFKYEEQTLAGAEYEIYAKNDIEHPDGHTGVIIPSGTKVADAITTKEGILVTNIENELLETYSEEVQKMLKRGLPLGEYEVKEVKAPEGYYIDEEKTTQEVQLDEEDNNAEVVSKETIFINDRKMIGLEDNEDGEKAGIYKYDEETKEPIQDVEFGIYTAEDITENGNVIIEKDTLILKAKTDKDGRIQSDVKLPLGKYYIKELKAAKGYKYDDQIIEFNITEQNDDKKVYNMYTEVSNKQTDINILKTDVEKNPLSGTKLQLLDSEGNVLKEWDSTQEAYNIKSLETEKEYKIKEIQPTKGYVTEEEKTFSLDKYGNIIMNKDDLYNENTILIKDEKTKLQIIVVDEKTDEELSGVHVEIIDKETNEKVYEFDTKEEKTIIEGLPVGNYDVIQKTEKDGYVTTHNSITIEDKKGVQENILKQKITKLDIKVKDTEEEKYVNVKKIEIIDINTGKIIASTEKNDDEETLIIEKLEDKYYVERLPIGNYKIKAEVKEGYKEIDEKEISIRDTEELQTVELETRKLKLDIKVEKNLQNIVIDNNEQKAEENSISKVDIHRKAISKTKIELQYIIKVTNVGEIAGNIGKIVEEIPEGMQFEKDKSDSNWQQNEGILISKW